LFACFAPSKNPEIVVAVILENAGGGGAVAAPVARRILTAYFEGKKKDKKAVKSNETHYDLRFEHRPDLSGLVLSGSH
jgi:hypothetical protein